MQLKYRYFFGGDSNPFKKEAEEAYKKLSEERKIADPQNSEPIDKIFPRLDSWPTYVIAESKSTFWQMERAIALNAEAKKQAIETLWNEALGQHKIDKWILDVESDETGRAMCYYILRLHEMFSPNDETVNFKLYFSESRLAMALKGDEAYSNMPYEG